MRRFALTFLLATLAACGSDATSPPPVDLSIVGTYTLRTVNGSNLPFVFIQSGQSSFSVVDDKITIADGGTWSENGTARTTTNGVVTNDVYADNGTWIRSGTSLVLVSTPFRNNAYTGTFTSSTLTIRDPDGFSYIFSR